MNRLLPAIAAAALLVQACAAPQGEKRLSELRAVEIEVKQEPIEDGAVKAMAGYERFLSESPYSPMAPEAIRRLADLKIEQEYGFIGGQAAKEQGQETPEQATEALAEGAGGESEADFERRATAGGDEATMAPAQLEDLERAGAREAIELYEKLLKDYPEYWRNDQVLYQMSRAYEELGRVEDAMTVMNRLAAEFPESRYFDEVQFRRAEYFFTRRHYLDAEEAYASIVVRGGQSQFFTLALYKLGWTFYKQELYEEALDRFIALLDYKVSVGYDFEQTEDAQERKRMDDTFRVISLSFSSLGGADSVSAYFDREGGRSYEDSIYSNLGEYYYGKRRYSDAVSTYGRFVERNRFHMKAPLYQMRAIEINVAGGFPSLVIESKKAFATDYGLSATYWEHFNREERPEVLAMLKTNLTDLANHYHALYRDPKMAEGKQANYTEAEHWYREFLASFPEDVESPAINYQLADLLMENESYGEAAAEYERTAYDYPAHERSDTAGYAAVYAGRKQLETVLAAVAAATAVAAGADGAEKPGAGTAAATDDTAPVRREVVRTSIRFSEAFPAHEKAAVVLGAAVDDLYVLKDYEEALVQGRRLIGEFPAAGQDVLRSSWLVVAHSSYEVGYYGDAEEGYAKVLELLPEEDEARASLTDNLAASIYRQGEEANQVEDYEDAAEHFLRVGRVAPASKIWANAEYDGAVALMQLKQWPRAAEVLLDFRGAFPDHELQPEVSKKLAYVYREDGQLALAAGEYERIETETGDVELRRDALLVAAELYEQAELAEQTLSVYRRYAEYFPEPVEANLEIRDKIATMLNASGDRDGYMGELGAIVRIEAEAGEAQTPNTRYIAAKAALVLAELDYERFIAIEIVQPIDKTLLEKQQSMKDATASLKKLLDYEVGEVTAAATFYLAEVYANFSKALLNSERPAELDPLELEQYELAIEEQAYPFEDKAIEVHESNMKLIGLGIYNEWVDKSIAKLALLVPARYAKAELQTDVVDAFDSYTYENVRPEPPAEEVAGSGAEADTETGASTEEQVVEAMEPQASAIVQGEAVQVEAAQKEAVQEEAVQEEAEQEEAEQVEAVQVEAAQVEAAQVDVPELEEVQPQAAVGGEAVSGTDEVEQ